MPIVLILGSLLLAQASAKDNQTLELYLETGHQVSSAFFSPDAKTIISLGDGTVKLWDVMSGQEMDTLKGYDQVFFSPDQKTIALMMLKEKAIILWDVASWRQRHRLNWDGAGANLFFPQTGKRWLPGTLRP